VARTAWQLNRDHCAISAQSLRNCIAIAGQSQRNRGAIAAQSQRNRSEIILVSQRTCIAIAAHSQYRGVILLWCLLLFFILFFWLLALFPVPTFYIHDLIIALAQTPSYSTTPQLNDLVFFSRPSYNEHAIFSNTLTWPVKKPNEKDIDHLEGQFDRHKCDRQYSVADIISGVELVCEGTGVKPSAVANLVDCAPNVGPFEEAVGRPLFTNKDDWVLLAVDLEGIPDVPGKIARMRQNTLAICAEIG
jgi:hypothetical protein